MITKSQRIQIVAWIRKGAPLKAGVDLYSRLPNKPRLVKALNQKAAKYRDLLNTEMCALLGITPARFNQIIKEHGTKQIEVGSRKPEVKPVSSIQHPESSIKQPATPGNEKPAGRSFRKQFPFLSRPDCPPELKSLAADKITAWENYTAGHEKLFDCSSIDECCEAAANVVENYQENRLIYEELEYYAKNGSILGKHRIFDQYKKYQRLRGYNVIELVKLHENTLPHRIWRIENEMKKGDKPHLKAEREKRLQEVKGELAEVKRLLSINA